MTAKITPSATWPLGPGERQQVTLGNGYVLSITKSRFSRGFKAAVFLGGKMVYDALLTDDGLGDLSPEGVLDLLAQVTALPPQAESTAADITSTTVEPVGSTDLARLCAELDHDQLSIVIRLICRGKVPFELMRRAAAYEVVALLEGWELPENGTGDLRHTDGRIIDLTKHQDLSVLIEGIFRDSLREMEVAA